MRRLLLKITVPVDDVDDVIDYEVAEQLQANVGWQRSPPPFLPGQTRGFGFEIPFFTGTFGPQIRTWRQTVSYKTEKGRLPLFSSTVQPWSLPNSLWINPGISQSKDDVGVEFLTGRSVYRRQPGRSGESLLLRPVSWVGCAGLWVCDDQFLRTDTHLMVRKTFHPPTPRLNILEEQ